MGMHKQPAPTTPQHTAAAFPLASPCPAPHNNRLKDFGPNRLTPADKPGFLARLWAQLNNILIYILLAAAIVEGALQSWAEFGLVMGVIVVNTAIGLIQEGKAEKVCGVRRGVFAVLGMSCTCMIWQHPGVVPTQQRVRRCSRR